MGAAVCCTTSDQKRDKQNTKPTKVQEQLPITIMTSKEAPCGPILPQVAENQSLNQPEDEPILVSDTEEKLSQKFKNEDHGEFYKQILTKWSSKPEQEYMERLEMTEGIYSGYLLNGKRHGAGTLVDKNFKWRMEGIWCDDKGFIETGQKEFTDGEVQLGKFVNSRFQEAKASLEEDLEFKQREVNPEVQAQSCKEDVLEPARIDDFADVESVRSEGGTDLIGDEVVQDSNAPDQGPVLSVLKVASELQLKSEARQQQRQYKSSTFSDRDAVEPIIEGSSIVYKGHSQANPARLTLSQAAVGASQSGRSANEQEIKKIGMRNNKEKTGKTTHSQLPNYPISYPRPNDSPYPPLIEQQELEKPVTEKSAPHERLDVDIQG